MLVYSAGIIIGTDSMSHNSITWSDEEALLCSLHLWHGMDNISVTNKLSVVSTLTFLYGKVRLKINICFVFLLTWYWILQLFCFQDYFLLSFRAFWSWQTKLNVWLSFHLSGLRPNVISSWMLNVSMLIRETLSIYP